MTGVAILVLASLYAGVAAAVGLMVLDLAGWSRSSLAPAMAPVLGTCAIGLQLWAYGLAGMPWHAVTLLVPWIVVGIVRRRHLLRAGSPEPPSGHPWWAWALGLAILALLVPELLATVLRPVVGNDAIAIWMMRAKVFHHAGRVDLAWMTTPDRHPDYPPLFSLAVDGVWVVTGRVSDQLGKAINAIFLVSLLGGVWRCFRVPAGARLTGIAVLTLVAMPAFAPWLYGGYYLGYADFATGCLMGLSGMALYTWLRGGGTVDLALAATTAILAALFKNEGLAFAAVFAAVLAASAWRRLGAVRARTLLPAAIPLVALAGWRLMVMLRGFSSEQLPGASAAGQDPGHLANRAVSVATFAFHLLDVLRSDYAWVLLGGLIALELVLLSRDRAGAAVVALVVLQAAGYLAVYVLVPGNLDYYLNTSADRLTVQLLPLAVVGLLGSLSPVSGGAGANAVPRGAGSGGRRSTSS